ncbi:MAG: PQQ-dependent sugar dehydrogenase [Verrucomicrobia bacterium]|nr:PQQ-dependent sugar dehydrogenase [Verrucomicrobiota bacterium]
MFILIRFYPLFCLIGLFFIAPFPSLGQQAGSLGQNSIPLPSGGVGVTLTPFVQIPNSPSTGAAPRLNVLREVPDGSGRLFVIDQLGFIHVIHPDRSVSLYMSLPAVVGNRFAYFTFQSGSTSFAFHPEFAQNGKLYVVISSPTSTGTPDFFARRPIDPSRNGNDPRQPPFHEVLLEFQAANPAANVFSGSFREVFRVEQPYDDHNIGEIAFNPNASPGHPDYGLLFIPVADGGNKFPIDVVDPQNHGQDPSTIFGTILRIDPLGNNSSNGKYGIPSDNPFLGAGSAALPEVYSFGHRNHHRITWDTKGDQAMYAFEMGQANIEEINRIVPGGNYGWGIREGTFVIDRFNENNLSQIPVDEVIGTFQYPVFQYGHSGSSGAIAGGVIYRGSAIPSLYGQVITADFTGNRGAFRGYIGDIQHLPYGATAPLFQLDIFNDSGALSDLSMVVVGPSGSRRTDLRIGTDLTGEVYFLNKRNGWIHKLSAAPNDNTIPWPDLFPDGSPFSNAFVDSRFMGPVFFAAWPWLFSPSVGWFFVPTDHSQYQEGFWAFFPR